MCGQTLSGQFPVLNPLQPTLVGHSAGFLAKVQFADELAAVTVDTAPPNLLVAVDGVTNAAPVLTNWVFGSGHNLSAIPVEGGTLGTRYVWTSWSNGGLISNQVSPSSPITNYVARFTTQYLLTMEAAPGGGVNPGSSWYDAGTVVSIAATPGVGWSFAGGAARAPGGSPAEQSRHGDHERADYRGGRLHRDERQRFASGGERPGTVSPNLDGKSLQVGQRYQMTAIPNPGYLFAGWSGDVSTNSPALSFVMASGLVLEASFVASPFAAAAGTYTGLFFDTNNLDIESSGLFTATLAANGACSASVRPGNKGYSVSRQFSTNGTFYGVIVQSSVLSPLRLSSNSIRIQPTA